MSYDPDAELVGIGIFLAPNRSGEISTEKKCISQLILVLSSMLIMLWTRFFHIGNETTGQFMITKIAPDGPAFRTQQIQVGDLLVQVDDYLLEGMQIDEVRKCITGPPHSDIYLNLLRPLMNAETGLEELNPIHVNMKRERSSSSQNSFTDRDLSPNRYDGHQNSNGAGNGPRMPKDFFPQPIVGQAYSQYTPSMLQVLCTHLMRSLYSVAIWTLIRVRHG
jgi:hypothetical protein